MTDDSAPAAASLAAASLCHLREQPITLITAYNSNHNQTGSLVETDPAQAKKKTDSRA